MNKATAVLPVDMQARHEELERAELSRWEGKPDTQLGYFTFPAEDVPLFGRPRPYRAEFRPCLHSYINQATPADPGTALHAVVTTWQGTVLGRITSARVYRRHNFGGRMVSVTVKGTNGVTYYGRASWDNGNCINLRKAKV